MTLKLLEQITNLLADGPNPREPWLEGSADVVQRTVSSIFEGAGETGVQLKDFLHGTWLAHPLHPALILLPAGSWTTAAVLDLAGASEGADTAIGFGILTSLPTAAAGLVDWTYTGGKTRRLGLSHAILNGAALGCYTLSWLARKSRQRALGVTLSTAGFATLVVSAYLGGEISYGLGHPVNRNAWSPDTGETSSQLDDFRPVARAADVREGRLTAGELEIEGTKIPLVLMKRGREILALNGTCSHLGGPLAEGRLVNEWCVECPWHASRFDFRDGTVQQGPAAYPQPRYETRVNGDMVEARLARPAGDIMERLLTSS